MRELVRVDQAAGKLVVGVGRKPVTREKLGLGVERLPVAFHQAIDFRLRRFISRHRIGTRQSREILPEAVTGDEAMKVVLLQAEAGKVVPASHVFARRRQTGNLTEDLEQAVVVEVQKTGM